MGNHPALTHFLIILMMIAWGCGPSTPTGTATEKMPPLAAPKVAPLNQSGKRPLSPTAPVTENIEDKVPPYHPAGKPDPFQPTRIALEEKGKDRKKLLPLEQFEVNDFELVAVVSGPGGRMAMVQDLTGKGYFIQVGSRIGKKGGKVVGITDKEIIIEEPYQDFLGKKSSRKTALKISPPATISVPTEKK